MGACQTPRKSLPTGAFSVTLMNDLIQGLLPMKLSTDGAFQVWTRVLRAPSDEISLLAHVI